MQKVATRMHCAVLESPAGRFASRIAGHEFLVLRTTGRKSGLGRETPLSFTRDGGAFVVIASDGGAPRHPDWYRNLQANPHVDVLVGGKLIAARAETVTGPDRDRLWRAAARSFPGYRVYQARTAREIPVLRLVPKAPSPGVNPEAPRAYRRAHRGTTAPLFTFLAPPDIDGL
jgi:F420H(2)-dependent quinone reductase